LEIFTDVLDLKLQEVNSDYEAKRYKSVTLELPHVLALADGTFMQWMRERKKMGGQNKVPRLANDRKYVDELLDVHQRVVKKQKHIENEGFEERP
jgi:hypothetical protein